MLVQVIMTHVDTLERVQVSPGHLNGVNYVYREVSIVCRILLSSDYSYIRIDFFANLVIFNFLRQTFNLAEDGFRRWSCQRNNGLVVYVIKQCRRI